MAFSIGAVFALGALMLWGIGDFLIQRTTRKVGDWEALFLIAALGTLIITPFVYKNLMGFVGTYATFIILLAAAMVMFVSGIVDFQALKVGKLAVVEPFYVLEIPIAVVLTIFIINEMLHPLEIFLIITMLVGLFLVSIKSHHLVKAKWLERGVLLAILAAIVFGIADFLVGIGARATNPLIINWFFDFIITIFTFVYLAFKGKVHKLLRDAKKDIKLILEVGFIDNLAWVSYAFATIFIPISVAVALSENFIAVAALLGFVVNREKFLLHQKVGLIVALVSVIVLALLI